MIRKPAVEAVILDMDGLMLDTESIYKRAWQNAAVECGYNFDDEFYSTLIGHPNPAREAAILERYGEEFQVYFHLEPTNNDQREDHRVIANKEYLPRLRIWRSQDRSIWILR